MFGFGFENSRLLPKLGGIIYVLKSLAFQSNEYLQTPIANIDVAQLTGLKPTFTINQLVKHTETPSNNSSSLSIYSGATDRLLYVNTWRTGTKIVRFNVYNNAGTLRTLSSNSNAILENEWYYISISVDGVNSKIFVNGVDVTNSNTILDADIFGQGSPTDYFVGRNSALATSAADGMYGNIAAFSIVDYAMSLAEHQELYNSGCPKKVTEVVPSANIMTKIEDNYSWNGASIVTSEDGWTSTNMQERDITPITPCNDLVKDLVNKYNTLNAWGAESEGINSTTTTFIDYKGVHNLSNPAAANQPTFLKADENFNNRPSFFFVTDDYLIKNFSDYLIAKTTGSIHCVFTTNADVTSTQAVFSSSEIAASTKKVLIYVNSGKLRILLSNTAVDNDRIAIQCDTTAISTNTAYIVSIYQDGTALKVKINGVSQSYTVSIGDGTCIDYWFANVSGRVNISIGATIQSIPNYADLDVAFVSLNDEYTDGDVGNIHNELNTIYKIF